MRKKTIIGWFVLLPDDISIKALDALNIYKYNSPVYSLSDAIMDGFSWHETKEGANYWDMIYTNASKGLYDNNNKPIYQIY